MLNYYNIKDTVLIIGCLPPPVGGVSVFVSRFCSQLKKNKIEVNVFNILEAPKIRGYNYFKLLIHLLIGKYSHVHLNTFDSKYLCVVLFAKKIKRFKLVATDHNTRLFSNPSKLFTYLLKKVFSNLDYLQVVSKKVIDNYPLEFKTFPNNIVIKNGFIPPNLDEEGEILNTYSEDLKKFIDKNKPTLIANASQIVFHEGLDLYGLDMCVELISKLKKEYNNIGLIFALANDSANRGYYNKIKEDIVRKGIDENIYFLSGQKQIWPLFKKCDIMLRPTSSDGYGISIDEALYFNCAAIASDVCPRNKDAIIFKSRNSEDLHNKTSAIIKSLKPKG